MLYTFIEYPNAQLLEVTELFNEHDNKVILQEIDARISAGCRNFVLDLAFLNFMNSVGINFLIAVLKKSEQAGGQFVLVNTPLQVLKLLEITKLTPLFCLQPTIQDALNLF